MSIHVDAYLDSHTERVFWRRRYDHLGNVDLAPNRAKRKLLFRAAVLRLGALLAEPSASQLFFENVGETLSVASLGGGPGETVVSLSIVRSLLGCRGLDIAVLDLEEGWRKSVEVLSLGCTSVSGFPRVCCSHKALYSQRFHHSLRSC